LNAPEANRRNIKRNRVSESFSIAKLGTIWFECFYEFFPLFGMSVVIELDSPYKKCTIKTTPGMSIQSIIEESCKQFQMEHRGYSLQFKKQLIEPSLPIRLANIPQGSKLSLIFKGSKPIQKVTIALQTESERFIDKVSSNLSLLELLLQFEQKNNLNIVKREESGAYLMPVCVFMNREYTTIEALKATTLVDIGLASGNGAIKVFGRAGDKPLSHYLAQIGSVVSNESVEVVKTVVPDAKPIPPKVSAKEDSPKIQSPVQTSNIEKEMDSDQNTLEEEVNFINKLLIELNTKIYLPPNTQTSQKINLPPSFYKLTTAELKQLMDSQRSKINSNENRPLMTQKMREKEEFLRAKKYPKTMVRVKFPSQITIEMCFYSGAKGILSLIVQTLFNEVSKFVGRFDDGNSRGCDEESKEFRLFISPPQKDLDPSLSFWKQGLSPASVVYFQSDGLELRKDIAENAIPYPTVEDQTVVGDEMEVEEEIEEDVLVEDYRPTPSSQAIEPVQTEKKFPKWLKFGK
jgi:hypothetical protein